MLYWIAFGRLAPRKSVKSVETALCLTRDGNDGNRFYSHECGKKIENAEFDVTDKSLG
jgi:hypothetical protein